MAGHVSGVQRRILDRNPNALFINCDNHSLNVARVHAASEETMTISFFGIIEAIYNVFSASTNRWAEFKQKLGVSMLRQSETRWSARDKAVRTVNCHLEELLKLLEDLTENGITADTKSGAHALSQSMLKFEFLALLTFWNNSLSSINRVQKRLQDPQITFKEAAADLNCLQEHIHDSHENICDHAIEKGKELCVAWGLSTTRRQIRRKNKLMKQITLNYHTNKKSDGI